VTSPLASILSTEARTAQRAGRFSASWMACWAASRRDPTNRAWPFTIISGV
jgi:hypothetical protein